MTSRSFKRLLLVTLVGCSGAVGAQTPSPTYPSGAPAEKAKFEFDKFMLVLLVRPANPPEFPKEELAKLQEGHMANMKTLHEQGKLRKAGPVEDLSGRNVRGIFVLTTESADEAREWISNDPLIKAGRLVPEFLKWYVEKGSLK